jgi:parallel beta-helix repeat protein
MTPFTVISGNCVITAWHWHIGVGKSLILGTAYEDSDYKIVEIFDCPNADLSICKVEKISDPYSVPFSKWIEPYDDRDEEGKEILLSSYGPLRTIDDQTRKKSDIYPRTYQHHWGRNKITLWLDEWPYVYFDEIGSPDYLEYEASVWGGDSGSAWLIKDDEQWKLAGVTSTENMAVRTSSHLDWIHDSIEAASEIQNLNKGLFYDSVQEAIDAADPGDVIELPQRTYRESINLSGKSITLQSRDPYNFRVAAATVIEGSDAGDTVTFTTRAGAGSTLLGITITCRDGNGIYCSQTVPTISNCIIRNCSKAGIYCDDESPAKIRNNIIYGNTEGIHCRNATATIAGNMIYGNGHGIKLQGATDSSTIVNSTIVLNTNDGIGKDGPATPTPTISNCIIWGNGNDLFENFSASYSWFTGDGDPLFIDPNGPDREIGTDDDNLRLLPDSPCVDAGDPNYVTGSGDVDLDGNLRLVDGNDDGLARIDMGAYELQEYCGGTGTADDPYLICNALHMQRIGANPDDWDRHFKLTADIDLSAYAPALFNIIGRYIEYDDPCNVPFAGSFDGNGHTISNLTYTSAGANHIGLFGYLTGQVRNLGLIGPEINTANGRNVGALAGYINAGTITDCYVRGGTVTGGKMVGGLLGKVENATIHRCFATCEVIGNDFGTGGLAGDASDTTISACYATGCVTADQFGTGGLVGCQYRGQILTSYATGQVEGNNLGVGGLVGRAEKMLVDRCYASGKVTGTGDVGGLVGNFCYSDIVASFWDITTTGQPIAIGYNERCNSEVYGSTTAQMCLQQNFAGQGWDFAGEIENGINDVWTIWQGAYYPRLSWEKPIAGDFAIDHTWMYQNVLTSTRSKLTADVSITDDPFNNSSYSYTWEIVLPDDVTAAPLVTAGGGGGDTSCTFAAPSCNEAGGISDSGRAFTVRVTVTGDDFGNTGIAEKQFGIALLGDINNDARVNVIDRALINSFWRTGSAANCTFRDCNIRCDSRINVIDRAVLNAVWRGTIGSNSKTTPCPLR